MEYFVYFFTLYVAFYSLLFSGSENFSIRNDEIPTIDQLKDILFFLFFFLTTIYKFIKYNSLGIII